MNRRLLIKNIVAAGITLHPLARAVAAPFGEQKGLRKMVFAGLQKPVTIYNNWSAYDELSDAVILTEALALKELGELVRMKKQGVRFDYYVMDAFWFDKAGGYRTWRRKDWPNGPDAWISACKKNGVEPGLWFSVNNLIDSPHGNFLDVIPEWKDSWDQQRNSLCLFRGGYAQHFSDTLQLWAAKGIKAFKFDFADFGSATAEAKKTYLATEIEELNKLAFIDILKTLRSRYPDVLLIGYNGFGGEQRDTYTPYRKTVESRWLDVFDTLYCGDPRFSDVPMANVWRSMDTYSDHMVRQYELNGLPLHRIDNCGFMVGTTGTCYSRADNAWKGMQILEMARGGWVNVFHGNLELLKDKDAQWFAKTQGLFLELQQFGRPGTFGELPGSGKPYGFSSITVNGAVCTVVNPGQEFAEITLPVTAGKSAVLYADGGYKPVLAGSRLRLGPEQLVMVGFDAYSDGKYQLGTDESVRIPFSIEPLAAAFTETGHNTIKGTVQPVKGKEVRIFFQQFSADNNPVRTRAGAPPKGTKMDQVLKISVTQGGRAVPVHIAYDKMIWSGLSWAAGEIKATSFQPDQPLTIECSSTESAKLRLQAAVYAVSYQP